MVRPPYQDRPLRGTPSMSGKIHLRVVAGELEGHVYSFDRRTTCIVGRATDANIRLPDHPDRMLLSRYHCLFDIGYPRVTVRDLGSLNGTFVNDQKIGQRPREQDPGEARKLPQPDHALVHQDRVRVGGTTFLVEFEESESAHGGTPTVVDLSPEGGLAPTLRGENPSSPLAIPGYAILRELGRGGMGIVYLAKQRTTGRLVAIKTLLPAAAASERDTRMFLREIEVSRTLRHPNVATLIDHGHHDGTLFLVMEYCDGGNLDDLLQARGGFLPVNEALAIIFQVLDGLEFAHHARVEVTLQDGSRLSSTGVVHRDLKPGNIFLHGRDADRVAKIADFGLAKAFNAAGMSGHTVLGDTMGTPGFMPRQQVLDFLYAKPELDVWAAAATLYKLLTNTAPRFIGGFADALVAILTTPCTPIRQRNPAIPAPLAAVIDRALNDRPTIAVKSAAEFRQALAGCR